MSGFRILIADDEDRIRKLVSDFLKRQDYQVFEAKDGDEALRIFGDPQAKIDLMILDVLMPGPDGWKVLDAVRKSSGIPVIMLTAKGSEQDQLSGFRGGADDYITKPFSPGVLVARVGAVLKRAGKTGTGVKKCGDLTVDEASHTACFGGRQLELTPKEYDLLLYLVDNRGIALSRESILNGVWAFDYSGDLRTVDTHIKQLRSKLNDRGEYISTVRGVGYRLEVHDETIGKP